MVRRGLQAAALLCAAVLAGCSAQSRVVGKWADNSNSTIEFFSSGTCLMSNVPIAGGCTWEQTDNGRVIMRLAMYGTTVAFVGQFQGGALVFAGPNGQAQFTIRTAT